MAYLWCLEVGQNELRRIPLGTRAPCISRCSSNGQNAKAFLNPGPNCEHCNEYYWLFFDFLDLKSSKRLLKFHTFIILVVNLLAYMPYSLSQNSITTLTTFFWNPRLKTIESTSCLAGFFSLQFRISNKAYSESLMHALSTCVGLIESCLISFFSPEESRHNVF